MNKLLLLALLCLGMAGHPATAQTRTIPAPFLPSDSLTQRIKFEGVVAVPGASAAELQARAREWVALTFQDAHQVTQLDDVVRGALIVRGYTTMWVSTSTNPNRGNRQTLFFTLRLNFREGRYRFEMRDLGQSLFPLYSYRGDSEPAIREINEQTYKAAAWQLGGSATVMASPRQTLFQPEWPDQSGTNDVGARFGRDWAPLSAALYKTLNLLTDSLGRHIKAPVAKW
jgi:hypothetical protein